MSIAALSTFYLIYVVYLYRAHGLAIAGINLSVEEYTFWKKITTQIQAVYFTTGHLNYHHFGKVHYL